MKVTILFTLVLNIVKILLGFGCLASGEEMRKTLKIFGIYNTSSVIGVVKQKSGVESTVR